jgi:uncharacterized membrane protein
MPHTPSPASPLSAFGMQVPVPVRIGWMQPLSWLVLGWRDICRAPWLSLAHGALVALVGVVMLWLGQQHFGWLVGAMSGFVVLGPVVATSLYAMSRALERGEVVNAQLVRRTWLQWQQGSTKSSHDYWRMVQFGALLALSATGWVLVSASLITVMSPVRIATPMDFMQHVVLAADGTLFALWLALGSFLAAPIFASSVVSMPLLLDRKVTLVQAVSTSWLVVLQNPLAMAVWAALIVGFTVLGLASLMLGLVLIVPMLGHASWHAYRDLVDASGFAQRQG